MYTLLIPRVIIEKGAASYSGTRGAVRGWMPCFRALQPWLNWSGSDQSPKPKALTSRPREPPNDGRSSSGHSVFKAAPTKLLLRTLFMHHWLASCGVLSADRGSANHCCPAIKPPFSHHGKNYTFPPSQKLQITWACLAFHGSVPAQPPLLPADKGQRAPFSPADFQVCSQ